MGRPPDGGPRDGYAALLEICRAIGSVSDEHELTGRVFDVISGTLDVGVCTLRILDEVTGELVLYASHAMGEHSKPVRVGESVVGRAVKERKPYLIKDIGDSPYKKSEFARRRGLKSLLSVPLLLRDQAVGGLTVYSTKPDNFSREDARLLCAMGCQLAAMLENGRLIRDTVSTLVSLTRALEAKDPYTKGHSARVTAYAARLAGKVGVTGPDLAMLKQIAPVHDIGKIGISEAIIHKPARLSPQEWKVMHEHPIIGERIVNSIRTFQKGLGLVRNHHEDVDGTGYPDGLKGNEIPLTVRIIRIADSYDAMTTRRPYREPLEPTVAVEELKANAGKQFDSELVALFCRLLDDGALNLDV